MSDVTVAPIVPEHDGPPRRRRLPRWLMWGFFTVVTLGLLGSILLPDLCRAREPANRAKCASNLHQIGLAILLYQADNGQAYPDTLGRLFANEQIGSEVFVCPSSNDEKSSTTRPADAVAEIDAGPAKHHCSYAYLGRGLTGNVPATVPIAYDRLDDHDETGGNVLFGDGHVDWETKAWYAANLPATTQPAVSN